MVLTQQQKIKYYKNKKKQRNIILNNAKKNNLTIVGARSLNVRFPSYLDKPTIDYDFVVNKKNPKQVATRIERKLDKGYGGDYYYTKPALHKGTYKVMNRVTQDGIVDVTKVKEKVNTNKINGINYSTLGWERKKINESLNDPKSYFRHDKDKERLQRIKIYEKLKKQKPKQRRRKSHINLLR